MKKIICSYFGTKPFLQIIFVLNISCSYGMHMEVPPFSYLVAIDLWPPLSIRPYLTNPSTLGKGSFVPHAVATYKIFSFPPLPQLGALATRAVTVLGEADHLFKAHQGEGTMIIS
jgi:hypothetical protein